MKKFTKLFLSCAIVSVVAAASASMTMAATLDATYPIKGDFTGTYTASSNDITSIAGVTPDANSQVTFLVYKEDATDKTKVDATNVIGIDQGTTAQPANNGLIANSVTAPDEGQNTYVVKIGYYANEEFKVATAKFVTGTALGEDHLVGDVDFLDGVDTKDSTAVMRNIAGLATTTDVGVTYINTATNAEFKLGDVDLLDGVDTKDSTAIMRNIAGLATTTDVGKTYNISKKAN